MGAAAAIVGSVAQAIFHLMAGLSTCIFMMLTVVYMQMAHEPRAPRTQFFTS